MNGLALTFALTILLSALVFQTTPTRTGNRDARLQTFLNAAMEGDTVAMLEHLDGGFDGVEVNDKNEDGETALIVASINGRTEAVRWLLDRRFARVNLKDNNQRTALLHAVRFDHFSTVTMLLARGGNPNIKDIWGNSPLIYAVSNANAGIIEMLLENGADIKATTVAGTWAGESPLSLAIKQNKADLVRRLSRSNIYTKYFKLKQSNITWENSLIQCAEKNSRLAQIKTAAQREIVKILAADATAHSGCSGYWLGGRAVSIAKSAYEWIGDKSPVIITNWAPHQPDHNGCSYDVVPVGSENNSDYCIRILQTGEWDDIACSHSNEMDGAICEYF